jgi:hypothetical protein
MTDFRDFSLNCPDFGRLDATASAALLRQRHRSKKKPPQGTAMKF